MDLHNLWNSSGTIPNSAEKNGLLYENVHLEGLNLSANILKANPSNGNIEKLILIIPGNPGLILYYEDFVKALFKELDDGDTAVWAISHSCHTLSTLNNIVMDKHPLDVEIEHKLQFIEQEVPSRCSITLVGHSIGCYMILSILQILLGLKVRKFSRNVELFNSETSKNLKFENLYSRIKQCYFLFPTIERMKITPNGKNLWPVLKYLQSIAVLFITIFSWCSKSIRSKLSYWVLYRKNLRVRPNSFMVSVTNELLTPRMFGNMLKLAYDELNTVNTLDIDALLPVKDKLTFYFGKTDGWCPLSYRDELLQAVPGIKTYVDNKGIEHAFVLKSSHEMALTLASIANSFR